MQASTSLSSGGLMFDIPSLRIVVVEDSDALREATVAMLQADGHDVTGVFCAEDVDDLPSDGVPDLYIVDINLPQEDGLSLVRRIRASQPLAGIILMTAKHQLEDRVNGYAHGADIYLIKPVERAELRACVVRLAQRMHASQDKSNGRLVLDRTSLLLAGPEGECRLNGVESRLLLAMSRVSGKCLERWQAMEIIDPERRGLSGSNLDVRVSGLRKKLRACGGPEPAIRAERGQGYRLLCAVEVR